MKKIIVSFIFIGAFLFASIELNENVQASNWSFGQKYKVSFANISR